MNVVILHSTTQSDEEAIAAFKEAMAQSATRRREVRERMSAAGPILIRALRTGTGQSEKVSSIIWSAWNGCNQVGLCDALCGLDTDIADAVVSLIAARAHLGGDADDLIRDILNESGEMDRRELVSQSEEVE